VPRLGFASSIAGRRRRACDALGGQNEEALRAPLLMASASFAWSDDREDEAKRVQVATDVLNGIMNTPDKGNLRGRMNPLVRF